jgi:hypothetical protein
MSTAVLINLRSRRGSSSLARAVRQHLPDAQLGLTRSLDEARAFLASLGKGEDAPRLILSGGGDGTAVSLLNAFDRAALPTIGLVPLGTGNGWARSTRSPSFGHAIRRVARHAKRPWPKRTFGLVEVEGVLSPWAGTGWDAEILADYQRLMRALPAGATRLVGGVPGYAASLCGLTIPRMTFSSRTQVRLTNLGSDALAIDASGAAVRVDDGGAGALLYEGPLSVCGCGTIEELGFGFRAFPFARARADRMAVRIYGESAVRAARLVRPLWRGEHTLPSDAHWLLDACRMEFDRPVHFEIGGDVVGTRTSVDYRRARERATLLDWSRVAA